MISSRHNYNVATVLQAGNRLFTMIGGLAVVIVAAEFLTRVEFAIFVSLQSIVQLRIFADALGGGGVVALLIGTESNERRAVESLLQYIYFFVAIVSLFFALLLCLMVMDATLDAGTAITFFDVLPVVFATPVTIVLYSRIIILESHQEVVAASFCRTILSAGYTLIVLLCLYFGFKFESIVIAALSSAAVAFVYQSSSFVSGDFGLLRFARVENSLNHAKKLWSLQWRSLLSWIGGYGMIFLPAPILFWLGAPSFSGEVGVSLQFFQALAGFSLIPLTVRIPKIAEALMVGQSASADQTYFRMRNLSVMLFTSMGALFVCAHHLYGANYEFLKKFPTAGSLLFYLLAFLSCFYLYCESVRYRAKGEERFWSVYLVAALNHVVTLASAVILDRALLGVWFLAASNLVFIGVFVKRLEMKK